MSEIKTEQTCQISDFLEYAQGLDVQELVDLQEWFEMIARREILSVPFEAGCIAAGAAEVLEQMIYDRVSPTISDPDWQSEMFGLLSEDTTRLKSRADIEHALAVELKKQFLTVSV